ncbi:MAG TPA: PaaI family thioesterase [Rubrobacteraceae bacterium]|nr:PaaI family thioesterase [Rubrobacteraceae bacterium]
MQRRRRTEEEEEDNAMSEQARAFEQVLESFAKQGLMDVLGAEVSEVGEGWCVIEVPYSEQLTQQQRYFHGAVAGAIGDSAGGYAALPRP